VTRGTRATIIQGGRAKAYRPMAAADRRAAFDAGLEAYERGDVFLAHELLEPAWMGTPDLAERELIQGLIKLAGDAGEPTGVDVPTLLAAIEDRLAAPIDVGAPPIPVRGRARG